YVNGTKITKEQRLKPGDRIEIGAAKLSFQLAPATEPGQPRKRGKLFAIAMLSISAIVVIELVALGIAYLSRKKNSGLPTIVSSTTQPVPATAATPAPPPATLLDETQKQLDSKLQKIQDLALEISSGKSSDQATFNTLAEQLNSVRSEIEGLKKRLDEIAAKAA